ncbi:glycosyltransferase family 4 protein [Danxiaibacter flavus]|uniref:Glycosyltransferase family 4 protein n=1 Tax=Danxiaibacter flavus TaxID=3049108 RepID=A0ABV3ZH90_9BACT|nr:glycosyltransferase family 4 protein [Chitinophagaceae bacterium DXS]
MKVLHIAESTKGGGAENVFSQTVKALKEYGVGDFAHYVAARENDNTDFPIDLSFPSIGKANFFNSIYSVKNFLLLRRYLFKLRPDVIHFHLVGNLSPSVLHAIFLYKKKAPKCKILQTVHTYEHVCSHHAAYDYRLERRCLDCKADKYKIKIFKRRCSRKGALHSFGKGITSLIGDLFFNNGLVDKWITPSEFLGALLSDRYGEHSVSVLKNSISHIGQSVVEKKNVITYFGRFSEEKNLQLLLNIMPSLIRLIPDIKLKLIGDGPMLLELKNVVVLKNLQNHVQFSPFMPPTKLSELIGDAKVFVLPSKLFETFSLVLYESVLADMIPIAGNYGALKEAIEWLGCGEVFDEVNQEELVEKIINSVLCYASQKSVIVAAKEKITKNLNMSRYRDSLIQVYRDCSHN